MAFESLTDRERQVLYNLISHYIQTADPVGSRVIARQFGMNISPATVRNTLHDLEELGLVEQPHTSAGRVPTNKGYRVYVDYLLKPENLTDTEKQSIKQTILREGKGVNEILGQTAKVISEITSQLGVTIAPRFEQGILHSIRMIPVAENKLMVVVIVQSGLAKSVILEVEASLSPTDIIEVESLLNERLAGLTLREIRHTIQERTADLSGDPRLIQLVVDSKEKIWSEHSPDDMHYAGTDLLVAQPEFTDRARLSRLIKVLEDGRVLSEFLKEASDEDLVIAIGDENRIEEIIDCSLIKATYRVGNIKGTIGIIGPTRLPYGKAVSIVEYTAKSITEVLSGMESDQEVK